MSTGMPPSTLRTWAEREFDNGRIDSRKGAGTAHGATYIYVLRKMASVISSPSHVGRLDGKPNRLELYRKDSADDCGVCVSIKCLHAETWVNTAFPLGAGSLQKHVLKGKLWTVEQHQGSLFNM